MVMCVIPVDPKDRPKGAEDIPYIPAPNMTHIACERCDVKCWVGPKILGMKAENPHLPIWCVSCVLVMASGQMN